MNHITKPCCCRRLPADDGVGGVLHDGGGLEVVAGRVQLELEELARVERHRHQRHRRHVAPRRRPLPARTKGGVLLLFKTSAQQG